MTSIATRYNRMYRNAPLIICGTILLYLTGICLSGRITPKLILALPASPVLLVAFLIYLSGRKLWNMEMRNGTLFLSKGKKKMELTLSDIKNIELVPNWWARGRYPFTELVLKHPVNGISVVRYFSDNDKVEEELIINPWRKLVHERATELHYRHHTKR